MNIELICVGNEILSGDVTNTNAAYISQKLRELGQKCTSQFTVGDDLKALSSAVAAAYNRCDTLILVGGLGPTADDITKEAACDALGLELVENEQCRSHIDNYFKSLNRTPTANNYKQAYAPNNAIIFPNDKGTACGICINNQNKNVIMLPGPPRELMHMFETYVMPYLKKSEHRAIVTHSLNVFGIGESAIETIIKPICALEDPVVATYCGLNECCVKVTATADTERAAERKCLDTVKRLRELLGDYIYGTDSEGLAHEAVTSLRKAKLRVSTAESCTGGMLPQTITSVPHASQVVEIGILAYSNRIKHEALSIPEEVLSENGAISPETAMYMAKNVRILSDSDIGIGITGNAGPGADENKPVGLVYVSIADKNKYYVEKLQLSNMYDRERVRHYATLTALNLIRRYALGDPALLGKMLGFDEKFIFEDEIISTPVAAPSVDNTDASAPLEEHYITFEKSDTESDTSQKKIGFAQKVKSALRHIFPTGEDRISDIIIKIVSILAAIGLIVSSSVLITHFADESHQRSILQQARNNFDFDAQDKNDNNQYSVFDELIKQNGDIKAWISISNTEVDNPVYQTTDNSYYLKHNMLKENSRYGALFFDCQNTVSESGNSKNLTVYGHNMRDKSMFGSLSNYRKLSFYKENPIIQLKTLYDQYDYAVFAVIITNASAKDDNGYIYNYTRSEFATDDDFNAWIAEAEERSLITTGIEITPQDEILTLSTCCYDFDNARFVIMAKKLTEDAETPDFYKAVLNHNVRYPQAWYDKKGLSGYTSEENSLPDVSSDDTSSEPNNDTSSDDSSSDTDTSSSNSFSTPSADSKCKHEADESGYKKDSSDKTKHSFICSKCGSALHEAHKYENTADDAYLKTAATCTSAAVYRKSCKCGAVSNDTFTSGKPAAHIYSDWQVSETDPAKEERKCKNCDHTEVRSKVTTPDGTTPPTSNSDE